MVPPDPSFGSTTRPYISMQLWLSGMMSWLVRRMIAHRLPVVPAFGARAGLNPDSGALFEDIVAIPDLAGLRIDLVEDVLEHRFVMAEILARLAVELPQNARLADGEQTASGRRRRPARARTLRRDRAIRPAHAGNTRPASRPPASAPKSSWCTAPYRSRLRRGWRASTAWPAPRPSKSVESGS